MDAVEPIGPWSRSYPWQRGLQAACLSMTSHIMWPVTTSFVILRQLRIVYRFLKQDSSHHLVRSLILSRIDYCNVALSFRFRRSSMLLLVWCCELNSSTPFQPWCGLSFSGSGKAGTTNSASWGINVWTEHHVIWQRRSDRYQMTPTGRDCDHQNPYFHVRNQVWSGRSSLSGCCSTQLEKSSFNYPGIYYKPCLL